MILSFSFKKIFYLLFILYSISLYARAPVEDSNLTLFTKANESYAQNQFSKALKQYEILIEKKKIQDTRLYYNYANTLYRLKKLGSSILYYEKALLLSPADEEIQKNLNFVRSKIQDKISQEQSFIFLQWIKNIALQTSLKFKVLMFLFLWFLFFLFLSLSLFLKIKSTNYSKIYIALFFVLSFFAFLFWYQTNHIYNNREAICLASSSIIYSGPGEQYKNLSRINEGTKIITLSENKGWIKIKLSDKTIGFISSNEISYIDSD